MRCVISVSYSVIINSKVRRIFVNRELRQGDSLSPILFILCAKVFSCLLKEVKVRDHIHRIKVGGSSPSIFHSFFLSFFWWMIPLFFLDYHHQMRYRRY